jgi:hypothetical protein
MIAYDNSRAVLAINEYSVGQSTPRQQMWVAGSLAVQLVVHGLGVCGCVTMGLAPRLPVGVVVTAPAFGTRPMTGGKGDCFVEKEQLGVVIRRPLGRAATLELQHARDPGLCLMVADDVAGAPAFVQPTPVAHPRSATCHGDDLAARCYPVTCGPR